MLKFQNYKEGTITVSIKDIDLDRKCEIMHKLNMYKQYGENVPYVNINMDIGNLEYQLKLVEYNYNRKKEVSYINKVLKSFSQAII